MVLGSWWALVRFALVFARSVALVPLILSYWDVDQYTCWVLLLAVNALWFSAYDGYIRYVTNAYNLSFYSDPQKARHILGSGIRFAGVVSIGLLVLLGLVVCLFPGAAGMLYGTGGMIADQKPGAALWVFIGGNTCINLLRFFYAINEPQGKLWRNLRFEVVYSIIEILALVLSLMYLRSFFAVVAVNATVYIVAALVFILSLRKKYPAWPQLLASGNTAQGAMLFRKSLPFIANNFIEKLATESYTLVLAFFAWPALVIQQFASVRTMTNAGISGMNIFQTVTGPQLQQQEAEKAYGQQLQLFGRLWLLASVACGTLLICLYPWLQQAYLTWTRHQIVPDETLFGLLFICLLVVLFGNVLLYYLKAVNETRTVLLVTIVKLAVLLALLVCLPHTAAGAVWALLAAETITSIVVYPALVARKWRRLSGRSFWPDLLQFLLPFIITGVLCSVYMTHGFSVPLAAAGYLFLLIIIWFLYRKTKHSAGV